MRKAFTMLELIFVIVIIGILAKFGTNILATAYQASAATNINNRLTVNTELTLKQLANRLQYRIKDSVIARNAAGTPPMALSSAVGAPTVYEWIGYDIDGWLGVWDGNFSAPTWSGFIDVNDPTALATLNRLESPATDTTRVNNVIQAVRAFGSTTTINNSAIFFTGANSDIQTDYGWNNTQDIQSTTAAHKISTNGAGSLTQLMDGTPAPSTFINTDVYENYKLSWTAYGIALMDFNGDAATFVDENGVNVPILDLVLYYDYQPWEGEAMAANGTPVLLLQDVDTFKFQAEGDTITLQICVNEQNALAGGKYALCKELAIF